MSYVLYWRYLRTAVGSSYLPGKALEREGSKVRRNSASGKRTDIAGGG